MRTPAILAALALSACSAAAPADPREAWLGVYAGTWTSEARDCATGEQLEPLSDSFDVEVVRSADRLAINGGCLIEFRLLDGARGRVVPSTCSHVTSDGTPVMIEYRGGSFELDGAELFYTLDLRASR